MADAVRILKHGQAAAYHVLAANAHEQDHPEAREATNAAVMATRELPNPREEDPDCQDATARAWEAAYSASTQADNCEDADNEGADETEIHAHRLATAAAHRAAAAAHTTAIRQEGAE